MQFGCIDHKIRGQPVGKLPTSEVQGFDWTWWAVQWQRVNCSCAVRYTRVIPACKLTWWSVSSVHVLPYLLLLSSSGFSFQCLRTLKVVYCYLDLILWDGGIEVRRTFMLNKVFHLLVNIMIAFHHQLGLSLLF